jgi:hypothetical protein
MNAAILILLPLGLAVIAYGLTLMEMSRQVPPVVPPEWATDPDGRPVPTNFNPPPSDNP